MTDTATQSTSKRILALPQVARLALFCRYEGPAVLITTDERLSLYEDTGAFKVAHSLNPDITNWHDRFEKTIVSLPHALRAFPSNPDSYALEFKLSKDYPREELLETLVRFGYERDEEPGFTVRGDTITLFLSEDDPDDNVRLEFFGDELDRMERGGLFPESFLLAPRFDLADVGTESWDSRIIEQLEGHVFLDSPELFAGDVGEESAEWLWGFLEGREVTSFGRDPMALETLKDTPDTLGYYRGRLNDFRNDLGTWLKDGYSVSLLLKFERTGRYLREKVIDDLESHFHNDVGRYEGELGFVIAPNARGGFRDLETKEIILTEDLLYGAQGARKLKRTAGKSVHDAVQLSGG